MDDMKSRFNKRFFGIFDEEVKRLAEKGDKEADIEYRNRICFDAYNCSMYDGTILDTHVISFYDKK